MCKFSIVFTAAGLFINLAGMFFFFIVILTPFFVCMHFFLSVSRAMLNQREPGFVKTKISQSSYLKVFIQKRSLLEYEK